MSSAPTTRFAPSPTGRLHLGNIRTALFNYLFARGRGGQFILRIEDTDVQRSMGGAIDAILEDLSWLGLAWDQGPGRDAGAGPYRQSERSAVYQRLLDRLLESGRVYPCWRTAEELRAFRRKCINAGRPPVYDREWATLADDEIRRREGEGASPALRFRVPGGVAIEFADLVRGPQAFGLADIGDFVVRRSDGTPPFFFCNAVDDGLMGVTHVLRGEDHLSNTPRQLLLLQALGMDAPAYGHLPLLVGDDGAPLSKRTGAASLADLRAEGLLPAAISNLAARLGHACERGDLMDMDTLAAQFAIERIGRAPARFDRIQLEHWQSLAVQATSDKDLTRWVGEAALDPVPAGTRAAFMHWVRPNVHRPDDVARWAAILYGAGPDFDEGTAAELEQAGGRFFRIAESVVRAGNADLAAVRGAVEAELGVRGKRLFRPLRLALTGSGEGPELGPLFELLPAETIAGRLERWAGSTSEDEE